MAALRAYYPVCALPGGRFPLGAAPDAAPARALLTLGRSVLMRYSFSDQKQLIGWTSKDFITAPVVYDTNEKSYVGIFNDTVLKMWEESVESLDKVKKIKFQQPIYRLLSDSDGKTTLVFSDGSCSSLTYSIYARKNLESAKFLSKNEVIVDAALYQIDEEKYICYVTKDKEGAHFVITCLLNLDINTLAIETMSRTEIKREELPNGRIIGLTISATANPPQVHILWSDGRMSAINLIENNTTLIGHVPWVSRDVDANLVWIGDNHIGIYGADSAQEGAVLVLYNVLFGVCACKYPLKLFTPGAQIWCLPENLLLESNQHLAVIQYSLSSRRNVLSLLDSNKNEDENKQSANVNWGKGKMEIKSHEKCKELVKEGISEKDICLEFLPSLLKSDNITVIRETLKEFTDVRENFIIDLIKFVIKNIRSRMQNDDITNYIEVFRENVELRNLLDDVLCLPFTNEMMIPYLRNSININDTLILLQYINYLLYDTSEDTNFSLHFEKILLLWCSMLIDSHFQELLLCKNKEVFDIINLMKGTVDDLISNVNEVVSTLPVLQSLEHQDNDNANVNNDALYSIEEIKLF